MTMKKMTDLRVYVGKNLTRGCVNYIDKYLDS